MIAWTWSSDFDLRKEIDEILSIAQSRGFGDISKKRILQCISAISVERVSTDDILDSLKQPEEIGSLLRRVRESLKRAIDLLVDEFNIHDIKFLPSSFQLIPLVYLFSTTENLKSNHVDKAKRWFWRTSFTTRYRDATNQRVREDISFFKDVSSGRDPSLEDFSVEVTSPDFFVNTRFHSRASATKAFILMLTQKRPKDLLTGERISIKDTLSDYRKSEYHHVFPRAFLQERDYRSSAINSLANRCLIKSNSNKQISDKPPSKYLFDKENTMFDSIGKSDDTKKSILKSNLLPTDLSIYRNDDFYEFISERKKILYDYFSQFS
jgi:hypothetical protein